MLLVNVSLSWTPLRCFGWMKIKRNRKVIVDDERWKMLYRRKYKKWYERFGTVCWRRYSLVKKSEVGISLENVTLVRPAKTTKPTTSVLWISKTYLRHHFLLRRWNTTGNKRDAINFSRYTFALRPLLPLYQPLEYFLSFFHSLFFVSCLFLSWEDKQKQAPTRETKKKGHR